MMQDMMTGMGWVMGLADCSASPSWCWPPPRS